MDNNEIDKDRLMQAATALFREEGKIGQKQYAGVFYEEFLRELRGTQGIEVYKEMETDDTCGAILYAIDIICRQVQWRVDPSGTNEVDRKAANFINEAMNDMEDNWVEVISSILSFLTFGWSWHEILYKRRMGKNKDLNLNSKYDDGLIAWKNIAIRSQDTLDKWEYDEEDNLVGLKQNIDGAFYNVPREKSLHFKTKNIKANPEGRSIFRTAYKSYYFKKRIQEIEGIGIERDLAGLPMLIPPENTNIWDNESPEMVLMRKYGEALVRNVRRDATEGLLLPGGWDFKLLNSGGNRQFDTNEIIQRYNQGISMTVLADFLMIGHGKAGSYNLVESKIDLFYQSLTTFLDIICDEFNNKAITKLIDLNESHFKGLTDYPKLVFGDIKNVDLGILGDFLEKMIGTGVIRPDEEIEDYVRQAGNLPERPERKVTSKRDYEEASEKINKILGESNG